MFCQHQLTGLPHHLLWHAGGCFHALASLRSWVECLKSSACYDEAKKRSCSPRVPSHSVSWLLRLSCFNRDSISSLAPGFCPSPKKWLQVQAGGMGKLHSDLTLMLMYSIKVFSSFPHCSAWLVSFSRKRLIIGRSIYLILFFNKKSKLFSGERKLYFSKNHITYTFLRLRCFELWEIMIWYC